MTDSVLQGNETLWQNIRSNAEISDFADLVEKSGFDKQLVSDRYLTVWAPENGTFDMTTYQDLDKTTLLHQFVKNHIADYNYPSGGTGTRRVRTLNGKFFNFTHGAGTAFGGVVLKDADLPAINGTLHILNGMIPFRHSIYEYLSVLNNTDSVASYIKSRERTVLDVNASVAGRIVDGRQTYEDSVMIMTNGVLEQINALVAQEDSSYTMILPTNKAYNEAMARHRACFNYINNTRYEDLNGSTSQEKSINVDAELMKDSMSRYSLLQDLVFNNNDRRNRWLIDPSQPHDSLITTTGHPLTPDGLLHGEAYEMSNGYVFLTDTLAARSYETWNPVISFSPVESKYRARVQLGTANVMTVTDPDDTKVTLPKGMSRLSYLDIVPSGDFAKPELDVYLPDILSTSYDIYVVTVPANISKSNASAEVKPCQLRFYLNYCGANGKRSNKNLGIYDTDPSCVDTLFVGTFTFPVAYKGLGDVCPNLKITSPFSVQNAESMAKYDRRLRIAGVILKPRDN